jgi:anti-anti-sigma factor
MPTDRSGAATRNTETILRQSWRNTMKILTSNTESGVVLIEIEGEIDAYAARELDRRLEGLLAQGHSRLALDASQIGFVSSAGLRALTFAQQEAQRQGGEVRIFGLRAQVRRVFEMTGLDEYLLLSETRQEAMEGW